MTGFSAEWLTLREPYDVRSRGDAFAQAIRARLPSRPLLAMDLGSGTGSNIRYLAARLGGAQRWLTIDNDAALIGHQPAALHGSTFNVELRPHQLNLATDLDAVPFDGCHVVTGSALLDLVSASWLQQLARHCQRIGADVLFALTYDGRIDCSPADRDDGWMRDLINQHQRGDKGFGPALGPDATEQACTLFAAMHFETRTMASDWLLEPHEQALQRMLIEGWTGAALEIAPGDETRIVQWGTRRYSHLTAGVSRIRVGHQDFMAWPGSVAG